MSDNLKMIVVISVTDRDGYDIPVVAADDEATARAMLAKWRKTASPEYWARSESVQFIPYQPAPLAPLLADAEIEAAERLCAEANARHDYAEGRVALEANEHSIGGSDASVWYGDGDLCAAVHGDLGIGADGPAMARLFAAAPVLIPQLLARIKSLPAGPEPAE